MRRALLFWTIGFALLVLAFFGVVVALNSSVFSAGGFASSYLDALGRHDAATARSLPGVRAPAGEDTALLTGGALGSLSNIRMVRDTAGSTGVHSVVFSETLGGRAESTTFAVSQTDSFLGLFDRWQFSTSPLATVSVVTPNDPRFRVNGQAETSDAKFNVPRSYVVFAPEDYEFDHVSTYLRATPVNIPVSEPGSVTPVRVEAEPKPALASAVSKELDQYYKACATQHILFPTSCPFGQQIDNRVIGTPEWSIAKDPPVTIVPNEGSWLVSDAVGEAHLVVKVQSLYDGSISTFDANVPFHVAYRVTISASDHLTIQTLYATN